SSGGVVGGGDAAFGLEAGELADVLAGEFEPHAGAHAVALLKYEDAEMIEGPRQRRPLRPRRDPGAAGGFEALQVGQGEAGGGGAIRLRDPDQGASRRD